MGKHPNDIKNEIAYFYAVVKNMDFKDRTKRARINRHETSIEEIKYDKLLGKYDMDIQLPKKDLLEWIELIENDASRSAMNNLNVNERVLLSHVFYEEKTQSEIAKIYNVTQQKIGKKVLRIIKKIRFFLLNK